MKLVPTRRTDYGVRALLLLAAHRESPVKAAEIAASMNIPQGFLHQVLQDLARAGLVASQPSRQGGYALARVPEAVNLLEIVEALEGPMEASRCVLRGGPCMSDQPCALHGAWAAAREAFTGSLASVTLRDIIDEAATTGRPLGPFAEEGIS